MLGAKPDWLGSNTLPQHGIDTVLTFNNPTVLLWLATLISLQAYCVAPNPGIEQVCSSII